MGKDPRVDAEKELNKAELYFDNEQYKKAGKSFKSAGDSYFKLREFKIARECYSYAAKSFDFESKSDITIEALRSAGDSSLFIEDFSTSNKFFKNTIRFIPDLYKVENRNLYYLFFSTLSYLCLFLEGKQDQGLEFIKEIRKDVESEHFKDSPYIGLIKDLTIAIRDKNEKYGCGLAHRRDLSLHSILLQCRRACQTCNRVRFICESILVKGNKAFTEVRMSVFIKNSITQWFLEKRSCNYSPGFVLLFAAADI